MTNDAGPAGPRRLIWQADETGAVCGLPGHFWATVRQGNQDGHAVWSWMVIGCETQVLAAGRTGDRAAGKLLAGERDRWVSGPEAAVDSAGNPVPTGGACGTCRPAWPR